MIKMAINTLIILNLYLSLNPTYLWAQPIDRTHGLVEARAPEAKAKLLGLRDRLVLLDANLETTKLQVLQMKGNGFMQGTSLAMAGAGLVIGSLGSLAFISAKGSAGGNSVAFVISLVGFVSTAGSVILSEWDRISGKGSPEILNDVRSKFANYKRLLEVEINSGTDEKTRFIAMETALRLSSVQSALSDFERSKDERSKNKIFTSLAQLGGYAISIAIESRGIRVFPIGAIVTQIGNISRMILWLDTNQTELLVKEIDRTRDSIAKVLQTI